ncbi:hypothetical protein QFZ63_004935 [Streptomyces sp. B3I7]|uniref:hypothetical protein n=1 Tax=Streptomyces sp. B3I7 TaxID=3042269 RepID=UPI002783CC9D|nr:hypothetical protein [Streptomyces sp. B3I7]MDQ0813221.1 hypothetical protein [Streptomyces sp. B3I7]
MASDDAVHPPDAAALRPGTKVLLTCGTNDVQVPCATTHALTAALRQGGPEYVEEYLAVLKRCVPAGRDDGGSGCWRLLHVDSAGEDGECTAYDWWPGEGELPESYDHFAALVRQEAKTFL